MGGYLGIGFGFELNTGIAQLSTQIGEVFDDAVVHNGHTSVSRNVWMRILVGGATMRRPPSVPDALVCNGEIDSGELGFEVGEFAGLLGNAQSAIGHDCDTCRIVSAVFQAPQSRNDDLTRVAGPDVTNDSAHEEHHN